MARLAVAMKFVNPRSLIYLGGQQLKACSIRTSNRPALSLHYIPASMAKIKLDQQVEQFYV